MHIELLSTSATAPSTGAAAAALAGDSLTVKNSRGKAQIIAAWGRNQVAGFHQIAFPSGHDTTRGFRSGNAIGSNLSLVAFGTALMVQPQELLSVTIAGSAVAGDVEQCSMLVRYDDLPGISQRLITAGQLDSQVQQLTTIEHSAVSTAGPSYGTPVAITQNSDLLLANRDYAILGATSRTACMSTYLVGPDTSNVRVGVPIALGQEAITSQWFVLQSRAHGLACIPVINSGNKGSTTIGVTADENAGTFIVTWYLALVR
jgi:hypothetical protein